MRAWTRMSKPRERGSETRERIKMKGEKTYRNAVGILLSDALGLSLSLLEGVLVLELGSHFGCGIGG